MLKMGRDVNLNELERDVREILENGTVDKTVELSNLSESACAELETRFEGYGVHRIINIASTQVEEPYYILHIMRNQNA